MQVREVPKHPKTPNLNPTAIELLTQLCFKQDNPDYADAIFAFSTFVSEDILAATISDMINKRLSSTVILTGGISHFPDSKQIAKPEAKLVDDLIDKSHYPEVKFLLEQTSTNLLDNVIHANETYDLNQFKILIYVAKAHAAGRSYLCLRKVVPKAKLLQATYVPVIEPDQPTIDAQNWHYSEFGKSRIWGEYQRIKTYGQRGDIEYEEVKDIVEKIEKVTS